MSTNQVESFSSRLSKELSALDWQSRNDLLLKIGQVELRMKSLGTERAKWFGPVPENQMLGSDAVVDTDQGERRGRVICFGIMHLGGDNWERSVVVHVQASGTHHEVPGSSVRLASPEDSRRMHGEIEMAAKLVEVAEAVKNGLSTSTDKSKKRGLRDPKLVEEMVKLSNASQNVKSVDEGGANFKVTGVDQSKRLYIFKSQLRVDLSGFCVDHPAVRKISDDEARDMHLGKVRGQMIFDDKSSALDAFNLILSALK